jgi:hypothetical protein
MSESASLVHYGIEKIATRKPSGFVVDILNPAYKQLIVGLDDVHK